MARYIERCSLSQEKLSIDEDTITYTTNDGRAHEFDALEFLALLSVSSLDVGTAMFETTSAITTTGLSTGVTGSLPDPALLVLTVLLYVGRLGPVSLGAALALRESRRLFRYPEGRPNVG